MTDGTTLIDGFSRLLVFDKEFQFPNEYWSWETNCSVTFFVTKKGREAIHIYNGDTHKIRCRDGGGSRSWDGWELRRLSNAVFSEAKATSNGGGCWMEVEIWKSEITPISAEEAEYRDELGL